MTYHSSMGFEFDYVYLPYVNSDLFISSNSEIDKNVFILAMTRATQNLCFTYSGVMHPYLELIKDRCFKIEINDEKENNIIFKL